MKNFSTRVIFSFLTSLPCITLASDWNLFPWMQQNIYTSPWYESKYWVFSYQYDSVSVAGNHEIQLFNKNLYGTDDPYCLNHLAFTDEEYAYIDYNGIDSIIVSDGIDYFVITDENGETIDTFIFYPLASINDSWTTATPSSYTNFDSIRITCSSISEELIFGFTDSVKTFDIQAYNNGSPVSTFDNYKIRLSKQHGLLEFIPFRQFFIQYTGNLVIKPLKLIGINSGGVSAGFSTPKFEDYFDYQVGSILKWHHTNTPGGVAPTEDFWRDSIKQVISTPDSVKIIFDRAIQHNYWGDTIIDYVFDLSQTVHKYNNRYNGLPQGRLSIGSMEFADATNLGSGGSEYLWTIQYATIDSAIDGDPVFEFSAYTDLRIDTSDCTLYEIYELQGNYSFSINSKVGIIEVSNQYPSPPYIGFNNFMLIGYVIGNDSSGDYFPIGIHEVTKAHNFAVTPSLAGDEISITFSSKNSSMYDVFIFNIDGKLLKREEVKDEISMDITNFPRGLYFVLAGSDEAVGTAKFMKQ